jgi:hypothetical protein
MQFDCFSYNRKLIVAIIKFYSRKHKAHRSPNTCTAWLKLSIRAGLSVRNIQLKHEGWTNVNYFSY